MSWNVFLVEKQQVDWFIQEGGDFVSEGLFLKSSAGTYKIKINTKEGTCGKQQRGGLLGDKLSGRDTSTHTEAF